uniref:Uncharacterized protein n=1 Tax=Arcella intermedia TaxID=1963864 RepID=A0A6B2LLW4_9EUKA|eukprot:TRINITY_DN27326_c0_g1_i1.p1 TRINITY_DN27326_c0_g1~~TRINITY_DN27326_c0_g1_i1.p1  ORF type:complete len:180 (-),score=30.39 TRINITY_DN27326_c0_g1_i1:27-566(-)
MGFLISKIWSALFDLPEIKIIIVGLDNAGKTTTLYTLLMGEVYVTKPTVGSNVEEILYKNCKFVMWDIGGQENLRLSWPTYYNDTSVVIYVIDSTDRDRMALSKAEMYKMLEHDRLKTCKLLILANKNDLKGAMTQAEVSEFLGVSNIKDHDWHIQSCCALTGEGLKEGMEWIAQNVKK